MKFISDIAKPDSGFWKWTSNAAAVVSVLVLVPGWFQLHSLSDQVQEIRSDTEAQREEAEAAIQKYFIEIERGNSVEAWNILSPRMREKLIKDDGGFEAFHEWVQNIVTIEDPEITQVMDANGILSGTYRVEFNLKERGKTFAHQRWQMSMIFNGKSWSINGNDVL